MRFPPSVLACAAVVVSGLSGGCSAPEARPDFHSNDTAARFLAIREAAVARDRTKIPDLISRLDSDDPAERLLALNALQRITGQTLGYDYTSSDAERSAAVSRWVAWWNQNKPAANDTKPTPTAGDRQPPSRG